MNESIYFICDRSIIPGELWDEIERTRQRTPLTSGDLVLCEAVITQEQRSALASHAETLFFADADAVRAHRAVNPDLYPPEDEEGK